MLLSKRLRAKAVMAAWLRPASRSASDDSRPNHTYNAFHLRDRRARQLRLLLARTRKETTDGEEVMRERQCSRVEEEDVAGVERRVAQLCLHQPRAALVAFDVQQLGSRALLQLPLRSHRA